MQFRNIDVFIKVLLVALLAFLSSCSRKETSNRRLPKDNANNLEYSFSDSEDDSKVKRVDDYYDAYQKYQSNDAPVSLKDLKKVRRRPVLNIQELNDIMDNSYNKSHVNNSHKHSENEHLHDSQIPCTESDCDIERTIQYNKRKAKKYKLKAKKHSNDLNNSNSSQIAETTKIKEAQPSANDKNKQITIQAKEKQTEASITSAPVAPITQSPSAMQAPTTNNKIAQDSTAPIQKANDQNTTQSAPIAKPSLPPINLPEANVATPTTAPQQKIEPAPQPVVTTPTIIKPAPVISADTPVLKPAIAPPIVKQPAVAPTTQNNNINITPVQPTNAPVAVAKLNKYTKETKLDTLNNLLVKYIFTIKSKIVNIFSHDD